MSAVVDLLAEYPVVALALGVVLRAALAYQSELSWPEYRAAHALKRATFPALQRRAPWGFDSFVNPKGGRDDAEYLATVDARLRHVVGDLRAGGGSLHLLNSIKRRPAGNGDPLTAAHVVYDHGTDQTEAYLFHNDDGSTDVYAHFEPSPETPVEHLEGNAQMDGDPRGVVGAALDPNP